MTRIVAPARWAEGVEHGPTCRRAIGFVREDLSGSRTTWDCRDITLYAAAINVALVKILTVPPNFVDPDLLLLRTMHKHVAELVITPGRTHVAGRTGRVITAEWDLHIVDGRRIYLRGHQWPSGITVERAPVEGRSDD